MADNINVLFLAESDINGQLMTEEILDNCISQVAPLQFNFSLTTGVDQSTFYVSSYEKVQQYGKSYFKIIVYQLLTDTSSTSTAIEKSSIDKFNGFKVSGVPISSITSPSQGVFYAMDLGNTNHGLVGIRSCDEWGVSIKHPDVTFNGYTFGRTPNVSLQWELEVTASTLSGQYTEVNFLMLNTGSYFGDVNGPNMTSGVSTGVNSSSPWSFPISQSVLDAYNPATQTGGAIAKRWGQNNPMGKTSILPQITKFKISGSVRADAMVSESVWYPYYMVRNTNFSELNNLEVTLSLDYDNLGNSFFSTDPITTLESSSQTLSLLVANSGYTIPGQFGPNPINIPFQYSDYDVLINNALVGRPNNFLQQIDYQQQSGGSVTTQLAKNTIISSAPFNIATNTPITSIGEDDLFYGYDVGVIEGVEPSMMYGQPGTGGLFDITIEDTLNSTGLPAPNAFYQKVTQVVVNSNTGNSINYITGDRFRFTTFYLNQQSTLQGTGAIGTTSPAQLQQFNLFSFAPTTPVNIQQIIANAALPASVPESNYTSLASSNPRYNGCELTSVDYNFYTPIPSQSQAGVGKKYRKGIKSPLQSQKLLPLNKVKFLNGNTGSWGGDISYGNEPTIDKRPTYFAHFNTSISDPTFYDTTTFAIDSLIFVPDTPIENQKGPVASIIQVDGSGDRLQEISSTFEPNREATVIYNNSRRSYQDLIYGEFTHETNPNNYLEGTDNTGSLSFRASVTSSNFIEAPATEFQFIGGNEYSKLGTTPSQSFSIPNWFKTTGLGSALSNDQQYAIGGNLIMFGSTYLIDIAAAWQSNEPLKFNYNTGVVPMFVTASYNYNSTNIIGNSNATGIAFSPGAPNFNMESDTSGFANGGTTGLDIGNFPNPPGSGPGLTMETIDGKPGRGVSGSLSLTCENGVITGAKLYSYQDEGDGFAFGDQIKITESWLNFNFPGSTGTGTVTMSLNDSNYFRKLDIRNPSSEGEDLGMLVMKGPVAYFDDFLPRGNPNSPVDYFDLQAPLWGMMNTWNHATKSGSLASGSQQNTASVPYSYSPNGYSELYMDDGDGLWSLGNYPYPAISSTPRQYQSVVTATHQPGWIGGRPLDDYNQFNDIGEKGRSKSQNYWKQNISESQLWNFEDQDLPFMVEVGDELRVSYKYITKVRKGMQFQTGNVGQTTTYTQDFTVVDFWQPAPSLITDWYSESDVPDPGDKPQMNFTCSNLPLEGVYSPEEVSKRLNRQVNEQNGSNNGGSVFIKADKDGASFTNQENAGCAQIKSAYVLHSMRNGDPTGSVALTLMIEKFPPSSSEAAMTNKHTYIIGTNQGFLDLGVLERSSSIAGGPVGYFLANGGMQNNTEYPVSGSYPYLYYTPNAAPVFGQSPDPAFAFDRMIVHPDPRKLEFQIPSGSIRSVTIRKRNEMDNRVVLNTTPINGELGAQTPTGDGYLIPNDLSPIQQTNIKTLIKELKAKRIFTKDSDNNVK